MPLINLKLTNSYSCERPFLGMVPPPPLGVNLRGGVQGGLRPLPSWTQWSPLSPCINLGDKYGEVEEEEKREGEEENEKEE